MREVVKRLMDSGKLTKETLHIASAINEDEIAVYLSSEEYNLGGDDGTYLYELTTMLDMGIDLVSSDERVSAIIDVLKMYYKLSYKNMALLLNVSEEAIENIHVAPEKVEYKMRYDMVVKIMIIYYVLKYPNYVKIEMQREIHSILQQQTR